ncbi:MAG: diguanylate cyclase [Acidobacteria bacterium]|nr:diguanylate cyclase [Acidobacteriota bacterium]
MSILAPPSFALTAVGDLVQCLLLSSLLVALAINVCACSRAVRIFWLLLLIGVGFWLLAQTLWTYFEVILRREVPNPFVGDLAIVLHLVPIVAALAMRPDREEQRSRLTSLDFLLLFSWWLYLYLFFVIPWQYVHPDDHTYGRNFDVLYIAGHIVVLLASAHTWYSSSGFWRTIYRGILLASLVYAAGSIAASVAIDYGRYYTGSLYDVPLLISAVLFTWVALLGYQSKFLVNFSGEPAPWAHPWVTALTVVATASLPLLAGWAVFFSHAPQRIGKYRLALTLTMIVFVGALRTFKQHTLDRELARATKELHEASVTDLLTGVRNRRFFAATINKDTQQALRFYSIGEGATRNRDLIFYLIDIDHFKAVNDRFGHQQGDLLLVQVAARISTAIRYSDVLIRWGGEEFLVVSRFTDRADAEILARRVLHAIGTEEFQLTAGKIRRTCSIGWATFPWWPERAEAIPYADVIRFADRALYEAKNRGRNMAVGIIPEYSMAHYAKQSPPGNLSPGDLPGRTVVSEGPPAK